MTGSRCLKQHGRTLMAVQQYDLPVGRDGVLRTLVPWYPRGYKIEGMVFKVNLFIHLLQRMVTRCTSDISKLLNSAKKKPDTVYCIV